MTTAARPLELAATPKVDVPITFHVWCSRCGKARDFDAASPVGLSRRAVVDGCQVPDKCTLEYHAGTFEQWLTAAEFEG